MSQSPSLSRDEQGRRRHGVYEALVNTRLEGLEPDPIFFEYAERYVQGEMTIAAAIADYLARVKAVHSG